MKLSVVTDIFQGLLIKLYNFLRVSMTQKAFPREAGDHKCIRKIRSSWRQHKNYVKALDYLSTRVILVVTVSTEN